MLENQIKIQNIDGELYIPSDIVASGFGIQHESLCKAVSQTFTDLKSVTVAGKDKTIKPSRLFCLTERQVMIIPAMTRPTKATIAFQTELVDAFIAARAALQSPAKIKIPTAIEIARAYLESLEKIEALNAELAIAKPKATAWDRIINAEGLILPRSAAAYFGFHPQKDFFDLLRLNDLAYYKLAKGNKGHWVASEKALKMGLMVMKVNTHWENDREVLHEQLYILPKGMDYLSKKIILGAQK